jgi:predicted O-linked N-acetylglucosamine transferase (SPINDLY family)
VLEPDAVTERIRTMADQWRSIVEMDDDDAAACIRRDRIDVLVDLTMHMDRNRLPIFAAKPAPVQVTWLAYPGTTGLTAMDYRITDGFLDPSEVDPSDAYAEESIRLPDAFWCYDPLTREPTVTPLPARTSGFVRFGCLNNFCKVNDGVLELWARILEENPDSRLVLLAPLGEARRRALERFARRGVSRDRIEFATARPFEEYLRLYQRIDICLDPVPYNGHTTSLDAFWMGVPVVTLVGDTVVGRAGLCQAMNLGLPELVARTADEYVATASALARDLDRLGELRSTLRSRMENSPLMDAPRFAHNLEQAYRDMWRRWCRTRQGSKSS